MTVTPSISSTLTIEQSQHRLITTYIYGNRFACDPHFCWCKTAAVLDLMRHCPWKVGKHVYSRCGAQYLQRYRSTCSIYYIMRAHDISTPLPWLSVQAIVKCIDSVQVVDFMLFVTPVSIDHIPPSINNCNNAYISSTNPMQLVSSRAGHHVHNYL